MILCYKNFRQYAVLLGSFLLLGVLAGCGDDVRKNTALLEESFAAGSSGDWKKCEANALEVLKDNPDDADALMLRSIALWHQNRRDVALASARQAVEIAPESFQAQYLYGWLLAQRNDSAQNAVQVLKKALKLRPGDKNTLLLLVQCCQKINSEDMFVYLRDPALKDYVASPELQTLRAIYYLDRRDGRPRYVQRAESSLRRAYEYKHRTGDRNPDTVLNMALFYDHYRRDRRQARRYYEQYLVISRDKPELNPTRAQVRARLSKLR